MHLCFVIFIVDLRSAVTLPVVSVIVSAAWWEACSCACQLHHLLWRAPLSSAWPAEEAHRLQVHLHFVWGRSADRLFLLLLLCAACCFLLVPEVASTVVPLWGHGRWTSYFTRWCRGTPAPAAAGFIPRFSKFLLLFFLSLHYAMA